MVEIYQLLLSFMFGALISGITYFLTLGRRFLTRSEAKELVESRLRELQTRLDYAEREITTLRQGSNG